MDVYYDVFLLTIVTNTLMTNATYTIVGSPQTVAVGDTVTLTLMCTTLDSTVRWYRNTFTIAIATGAYSNGTCVFGAPGNTSYNYECFPANATYHVRFVTTITEEEQNVTWRCGPAFGSASNSTSFKVIVPVTTVTLTATGNNNVVDVLEGENQTFYCTTGTSRPAAWIQWYIGELNVTNQATLQPPTQDGDKFISSSRLVYTGRDIDHHGAIYCEAVNYEGSETKRSNLKTIFISVPVKTVTLNIVGNSDVVNVVTGQNHTFTCTTGTSRPAAWIQWYIGGQNVTNQATTQPSQQDGDKFISSSILVYTGRDTDHNKSLHCKAVNIDGRHILQSSEKRFFIINPITTVTLTPTGYNNVVDVVEGENQTFTCTTGTSRPAAWIQWYIGGQNVTNLATPRQPQQDGDNFISSSRLLYIGRDIDHNIKIYCEAANFEGIETKRSNQKSFFISKKPVLNEDMMSSPLIIGLKIGMMLNITINVIANPSPSAQWIFEHTNVIKNITGMSDISSNGFQHTSTVIIPSITSTQFGSYTVYISNSVGNLTRTFSVIQKEQPMAPHFIYAFCKATTATLLWKSAFNGGSEQFFKVQFRKSGELASTTLQQNISDQGFEFYQNFTISDLSLETTYQFSIMAINEIGITNSNTVDCTTDGYNGEWYCNNLYYPCTDLKGQILANSLDGNGFFAAGISSLVLALIIGVFFIIKCRLQEKRHKQRREETYEEMSQTNTNCNDAYTTLHDTDVVNQAELENPFVQESSE